MQIKFFTIPNILTLCNLLCGCLAAVSALVFLEHKMAFWFIIAAGVFDFFDGFVARALKSCSPIGIQLDSLADMISFGFAPAAVLFTVFYGSDGLVSLSEFQLSFVSILLFSIVAFSALRLAKFNIDDSQHEEFCGLPTPANALFFVSLGWLWADGALEINRVVILCLALIMSLLLISPIRMFSFKFKGFGLRGNVLRYSFIVVCILLFVFLREAAFVAIIPLYIILSTIRWAIGKVCCKGDNK